MTHSETERRSWERLEDVALWQGLRVELGLSPRELDVAILLVRGFTLSQMAERLGIKKWTVVTYVARLKKKAGTRDRCRLVVTLLLKSGLLLGE